MGTFFWALTISWSRLVCEVALTANLDYNEEVHPQSIVLGEWSNMIGYEMSSSLAGVYTIAKTSLVEYFKRR